MSFGNPPTGNAGLPAAWPNHFTEPCVSDPHPETSLRLIAWVSKRLFPRGSRVERLSYFASRKNRVPTGGGVRMMLLTPLLVLTVPP
jgi:hypothetical protein